MPDSEVDLLALPATHFLSGAAKSFMAGAALDLLAPLSFWTPGAPVKLTARRVERRQLAEELGRANVSYGHPRAQELATRLADPATLVIVTGQQAGLFGGPLLGLTKMIAAAKWAARLEREGIPAVAVFWVATEDHDFAEIARCVLLSRAGPQRLELGPDKRPLMPVGMRTLGPGVRQVLAATEELYDQPAARPALQALNEFYRPDARIGEAFSRFMIWLLGERAPLLLDSMLPALKKAQKPWMRQLLERRSDVARALAEAEERIKGAGYKLQVRAQPDASPLFRLHRERRCRIVWLDQDRYDLRGAEQSDQHGRPVEDLLEVLEQNPSVISPGVLARPVLQDAVLGSALQLMGPGELAYMTQASVLYRLLEIEAPVTSLRPQILVLSSRHRQRLQKLGMTLEQVVGDETEIERRLARRTVGDLMERTQKGILERLDDLRSATLEIDKQLERPWQKTRARIEGALETFSGKVVSAAARREQAALQQVDDLRSVCLPLGAPQERVVSTAHFALTYGQSFSTSVWDQMDLDSDRIQIIDPQANGS